MSEEYEYEPVVTHATSPPPNLPLALAKGISAVMAKVKTLAKDGRNSHANYDYTSVDKFYEFVGPLMSEAGIFVVPFEVEREVLPGQQGKAGWLRTKFAIMMYESKESGAGAFMGDWTVEVAASGPQASASARSFVTKYFERNLFQIPTGDTDDADSQAPEAIPEKKPARRQTASWKPSPVAHADKAAKIAEFLKTAVEFVDGGPSAESLLEWESSSSAKLKWLREQGGEEVTALDAKITAIYDAGASAGSRGTS